MSKQNNRPIKRLKQFPGFRFIKEHSGIFEYTLIQNGLSVLYVQMPETGVVTTNITYKAGSRDEQIGETGIAHMLEHMLFKATKKDIKKGIGSGIMQFERETGCILNANTWKDRTTYFFSYPKTYFKRALALEAERMQNVILSDTEFQPERNNVLSEFDMYFGDPTFALSSAMIGSAFHSSPYGHETIGFREDIERYNTASLEQFYRLYYRPDNAVLMIAGDIEIKDALFQVAKYFKNIKNPSDHVPRHHAIEPRQEGIRRTSITRRSNTNLLAIGVKHGGFPSSEWMRTMILFEVLAGRDDSVLNKLFVDSGLAGNVEYMIEPSSEKNLGIIYITLAKSTNHADAEKIALSAMRGLKEKNIKKDVEKALQNERTAIVYSRDSSLQIVNQLTEYASAGNWEEFIHIENKLNEITPKEIVRHANMLFLESNLTIGTFIGSV